MYPSNQNSGAAKASEAATNSGPPSSSPSAPLLPQNSATQNLEPPPYSSVVAQDTGDWKNRSSSFSSGTANRPYPPAAPYLDGAKSTSGLHTQTPYPSGPPSAPGAAGPPYPSYGPPTQAPYPTGPGSVPELVNAPYPPGPAAPGFASQPPYPVAQNQAPYPVAGNQAPYPTGPPQIGFTAPITTEPRPTGANERYGPSPTGQNSAFPQQNFNPMSSQGMQGGLIHPKPSSPDNPYSHQSQYVPNQYGQQQPPPQTIYVVHKNDNYNNDNTDSCCLWACCLASCYCLCQCIEACAASDS